GAAIPAPGYWWPALGAIALNLVANLAFMQSVRTAPMSRTIPLLSLTPVFATLVAIPIFGEWPTAIQALGIFCVVATALILARGSNEGADAGGGFWSTLGRRGGLLMAFVAACWSVTPSLDKLAMGHAPPSVHALVVVAGVALGLLILAWRQRLGGQVLALLTTRRALALSLAAVAVAAFASGVQLVAYQQVPVGVVETTKRGVGASLALVFGSLFFSERIGWARVAAVAVMVAGVALVIL
ncbi:MAG: EamA family transporter, partial [Acidobacteriota bacterium]